LEDALGDLPAVLPEVDDRLVVGGMDRRGGNQRDLLRLLEVGKRLVEPAGVVDALAGAVDAVWARDRMGERLRRGSSGEG
jgi:hypothetical protein